MGNDPTVPKLTEQPIRPANNPIKPGWLHKPTDAELRADRIWFRVMVGLYVAVAVFGIPLYLAAVVHAR